MTDPEPYNIMELVMPYIPKTDRDSASLVRRSWFEAVSNATHHVTIPMCYTLKPNRLSRRFPKLLSIEIKGPYMVDHSSLQLDLGGNVSPWVEEISTSLQLLNSVHFHGMMVTDLDLDVLGKAKLHKLKSLKLDNCIGFSTDGLLSITRNCRNIETLCINATNFPEKDGAWFHELALHNTSLQVLNFYMTNITKISLEDLETIARNCCSLVSVKLSSFEISKLVGFFKAADKLEEFYGISWNKNVGNSESYMNLGFPSKLCSIAVAYMKPDEMPMLFPFANRLQKLDLVYAMLLHEDYCILLQNCPNLEVLEAKPILGNMGLEVLAQYCKKLKKLRLERIEGSGIQNAITHIGLIALAQGCHELEELKVYVTDITNASLEIIGVHLKNLTAFQLFLEKRRCTDFPLDIGFRSLLTGCNKLEKLNLNLMKGALTDTGLGYIGECSKNVRSMVLIYVSDSDEGLRRLSMGCPKLKRLEMRTCRFSEKAISEAALALKSLRYLWVQGYNNLTDGEDLKLMMAKPNWNVELILSKNHYHRLGPTLAEFEMSEVSLYPPKIRAYTILDGKRTDVSSCVRIL